MSRIRQGLTARGTRIAMPADEQQSATTIPLHEEQAFVRKERVPQSTVRINKRVHESLETVADALTHRQVTVRTVEIGEVVDGELPQVRQEGATTIIPVLEERLVIECVLVEEVHVTAVDQSEPFTEEVALRQEFIEIDETDPEPDRAPASTAGKDSP